VTVPPLRKVATELFFDGNPAIANCVTFAVLVFPETETVLVYTSQNIDQMRLPVIRPYRAFRDSGIVCGTAVLSGKPCSTPRVQPIPVVAR
jgi:hypothetical protein